MILLNRHPMTNRDRPELFIRVVMVFAVTILLTILYFVV